MSNRDEVRKLLLELSPTQTKRIILLMRGYRRVGSKRLPKSIDRAIIGKLNQDFLAVEFSELSDPAKDSACQRILADMRAQLVTPGGILHV